MMRLRSREFLLILIVWTLAGASIGKRLRRDSGEEIKTTSRLAPPPSFLLNKYLGPNVRFILSAVVSFIAAAVSTAGGLGGGGLFLPILTILAGMDLKTASGYSVLMVTGGMICSVGCQLTVDRTKSAIDFEVALLSEPCMLGGVTVGVICNAVFPDWLTFVIFVAVLSFNTFKTCSTAVKLRKRESRDKNERGIEDEITEIPIAGDSESRRSKPLILAAVWLCFFLMYLFRGRGIIRIKPCGILYWILTLSQIPLAIIFTTWILHTRKKEHTGQKLIAFPVAALVAGFLGGLLGIGGGMIIAPMLLQMGLKPEVTAATTSVLVLLSSSMSAFQYLLTGIENVKRALVYAAVCFAASLVGFVFVKRATRKGRPSIVVASIGLVMGLSVVSMVVFEAIYVSRSISSGDSIDFGFKKLC